jgi:biopolymer transport protein ExbD
MGRSFHRQKSLEANSELNVTALIDLGFALLIIFMISTPLIENEQLMEIDLPVATPNQAQSAVPDSVDLLVTTEGYQMDGNPVGMLELENKLARYGDMSDPPVLAIRANGDTPYQYVVTLLDLLKKNNLKRINLVTRPEDA